MNRANQLALFQATNQGLLNIRQQELNYYINLNIAFGTQAALIGGFTYGVFTQNQKNEDYDYAYIFQDIYWITSAGTIAASVHVIITTMLLQVLGPGLALHGPVGSVANAAEGLRREQKTVITAFIVMMILFSLSTVLSFWAVMSQVCLLHVYIHLLHRLRTHVCRGPLLYSLFVGLSCFSLCF